MLEVKQSVDCEEIDSFWPNMYKVGRGEERKLGYSGVRVEADTARYGLAAFRVDQRGFCVVMSASILAIPFHAPGTLRTDMPLEFRTQSQTINTSNFLLLLQYNQHGVNPFKIRRDRVTSRHINLNPLHKPNSRPNPNGAGATPLSSQDFICHCF